MSFSTTSALNTRGRILTRTNKVGQSSSSHHHCHSHQLDHHHHLDHHRDANKVVSFTDHRDFPMTSWSDMSDWPLLESMAAQVSHRHPSHPLSHHNDSVRRSNLTNNYQSESFTETILLSTPPPFPCQK